MIRSFRDRAVERLWMGAFVKRFGGVEKQAVRKLDMLHQAATSTTCARRQPTAWKLSAETARASIRSASMISGASVSYGPRRVLNMSKSSITTKGAATPNRLTTHPGEMLAEEFLKPLGLSVNALAMAL